VLGEYAVPQLLMMQLALSHILLIMPINFLANYVEKWTGQESARACTWSTDLPDVFGRLAMAVLELRRLPTAIFGPSGDAT
jgi:hypothetical protein